MSATNPESAAAEARAELLNKLKVVLSGMPSDVASSILSFIQKFVGESDRGTAVLVGCDLDVRLEALILAVLDQDTLAQSKCKEELFDSDRVLGTFSAKTLFSYAMGLIGRHIYDDVTLIRKVRNDFGHSMEYSNFSHEKIANRCKLLKLAAIGSLDPSDYRGRFVFSAGFASAAIIMVTRKAVESGIGPARELARKMETTIQQRIAATALEPPKA